MPSTLASSSLLVLCCMAMATGASHGLEDALAASKSDVVPAVIGKIMPLFFERASKVVIQLVRDNLSKASLGDLETYADGEQSSHRPFILLRFWALSLTILCEKKAHACCHEHFRGLW